MDRASEASEAEEENQAVNPEEEGATGEQGDERHFISGMKTPISSAVCSLGRRIELCVNRVSCWQTVIGCVLVPGQDRYHITDTLMLKLYGSNR